jgi:PAS domain S-box-containing protein
VEIAESLVLDTEPTGIDLVGVSISLMNTDRPAKESDVRVASETFFADAFESAPHAMALLSPDGRILHANRLFCRMVGVRANQLGALTVADITHPDDLATDTEQRYRLACSDIGRYQLVLRYLRRNREAIWVRLSVSAVRRKSGDPHYFVAQVESVTPKPASASADLPEVSLSRLSDATLSAIHEIGNCLTPLMVNTEMIVEQAPRGDVRELAHQIFKAARRIAFTLRRLRPIDDLQPVAYVGQSRLLDLRMVAPASDAVADSKDEVGAA